MDPYCDNEDPSCVGPTARCRCWPCCDRQFCDVHGHDHRTFVRGLLKHVTTEELRAARATIERVKLAWHEAEVVLVGLTEFPDRWPPSGAKPRAQRAIDGVHRALAGTPGDAPAAEEKP